MLPSASPTSPPTAARSSTTSASSGRTSWANRSAAASPSKLALDAPEVVRTLALLEPALAVGESGPSYRESLAAARQQFREGPAEDAVDGILRACMGPGYRARHDRVLPGWFDRAVIDAAGSFELDLPAWLGRTFGEDEAKRIRCPVLAVPGSESAALWARFGEAHRLLLRWLPDAGSFVLPGASQGLHPDNPRGMAEALASFWARSPGPASAETGGTGGTGLRRNAPGRRSAP